MGLSWVSHSALIYTSELILCSTIYDYEESMSKHFNIELRAVTFGTHLRKHLRLLVGYCETFVTGSQARLDHNVNSESTWSLEKSIPQDFSVIEILQNEKYITKSSKYFTYDLHPTGRFFHYNRNLNRFGGNNINNNIYLKRGQLLGVNIDICMRYFGHISIRY